MIVSVEVIDWSAWAVRANAARAPHQSINRSTSQLPKNSGKDGGTAIGDGPIVAAIAGQCKGWPVRIPGERAAGRARNRFTPGPAFSVVTKNPLAKSVGNRWAEHAAWSGCASYTCAAAIRVNRGADCARR